MVGVSQNAAAQHTVAVTQARWHRYVALGDSITEGFCDPIAGDGEPWLGWADRLAFILDGNARLAGEQVEFANLGVRGRRVRDVVDDQVPAALALKPDLVSVMVGGNDLMSPTADPDDLAARIETGIAALRGAGIDVLLANCFDPRFAFFLKPLRGRAAVFNANLWSIARTHETFILDVWGMREFQGPDMWAEDRVHLTPAGHRLLSSRAAHVLGIPYFEIGRRSGAPTPVPYGPGAADAAAAPERRPAASGTLSTFAWLHRHAIPWLSRRLRRVSAGDGIGPKRPVPSPVMTVSSRG